MERLEMSGTLQNFLSFIPGVMYILYTIIVKQIDLLHYKTLFILGTLPKATV